MNTLLDNALARFAFPKDLFTPYRVKETERGFYLVDQAHEPPLNLDLDLSGLFLLKKKMQHPKLSTQAAMLFGPHATAHKVFLEVDQREDYLRQKDIILSLEQVASFKETGYVIVMYQEFSLGLGLYFMHNDTRPPIMRSLFPKHWQGGAT